jgi:Fic family protein
MGTTGLQLSADVSQKMSFAPQFEITNSITAALTRIERARGFLDAAKLSEDWIAGMQKRALVLEAHYTTHIEGTQLTLEQSERILAGQKVRGARPDDAQELLNYKKAFELVSGYLESGEPITEALIRQIHKRLVQGVRRNKASPGEYRKIQNYIVNLRTGEKTYTPVGVCVRSGSMAPWMELKCASRSDFATGSGPKSSSVGGRPRDSGSKSRGR